MSFHGIPCWYELASTDVGAAQDFYAGLLGWHWADSGTPSMTYLLGSLGDSAIAGLYAAEPGQPSAWQIYFAVDDADAAVARATDLGAVPIVPATDIPGTGRFAILLDPQGAAFALLQPLPSGSGAAFDSSKLGHGNWHELVSPDPVAAIAFYSALFGWTVSREIPMGPDMIYYMLAAQGQDFGGSFAATGAAPFWKPYFKIASAAAAAQQVADLGGRVMHGPDQVQPATFALQITDPNGVFLALVGPA